MWARIYWWEVNKKDLGYRTEGHIDEFGWWYEGREEIKQGYQNLLGGHLFCSAL